MSSQNVLGMEDEAVASVSAQEAVRIVGTFLPFSSLLAKITYSILGLSVRRMEHNKKPLCIKLKLNGATHKKLPSADMTTTSERCKWNFGDLPLYVLDLLLTYTQGADSNCIATCKRT